MTLDHAENTGELQMSGCQCGQAHGACVTEFQYAVKLVCGEAVAGGAGAPASVVAPGRYWTAINIHNPDKCKDAHFRWKVAVALPGEQGPITAFQKPRVLSPDGAMEIDCPQVMQIFPAPAPTFLKGYVVIEGDIELDVVAVYTGLAGGSNSFHTERVPARCVPKCENLVMPLNTGIAPWQTIVPTTGLAAIVNPTATFWGPPPFGSLWISQFGTDGQPTTPGLRRYELCFDLCSGFTVPGKFEILVMADSSAQIFLNNILVGSASGSASATSITIDPSSNPNLLRAGRNCFRVDVTNTANPPPNVNSPTGFALAGLLKIIGGKCPCSG
jgi:hypothetical protein